MWEGLVYGYHRAGRAAYRTSEMTTVLANEEHKAGGVVLNRASLWTATSGKFQHAGFIRARKC